MVSSPTQQLTFSLSSDKASFDNFFPANNSELVIALKTVVLEKQTQLIYFYGPSGAGKSHLLFAAQRLAREQQRQSSYLSLSDKRLSESMLETVDSSALVCIDNVQAWAGRKSAEESLFSLFEQVKQLNGQLLISANNPPADCGFTLFDLVSRLSSALLYPLYQLTESQLSAAIKMRAMQRGMAISDKTIAYLLSRVRRDNHEIFSLLEQMDKASLIEKRRITIPFLRQLLPIK